MAKSPSRIILYSNQTSFNTFHLHFFFFLVPRSYPFVSLIRFGDTLLHVPAGTHLSDEVAQPLLDLSRHGITITPINSTIVSTDNTSSLTSSLSILKQSRCRDPLSVVFGRDHDASYKRSFNLADLPSAALDLSNRGGGG